MDKASNITSHGQSRVVFIICGLASDPLVSETAEAFSSRGHRVRLIELATPTGYRDQPSTRCCESMRPALPDLAPDVVVNLLAAGLTNPIVHPGLMPDAIVAATRALLSQLERHVRLVTISASWVTSGSFEVAHAPEFPPVAVTRGIQELEQITSNGVVRSSIVLRLAIPYGVGTPLSATGSVGRLVSRRRLPLILRTDGRASFIYSADAAAAIALASESTIEGVHVVGDDHHASTQSWLPFLARELSAPLPRRLPRGLAMKRCGPIAHWLANGSAAPTSTAFAQDTGWRPTMATWREGFASTLFDIPFADAQALISGRVNRNGRRSETEVRTHVAPY